MFSSFFFTYNLSLNVYKNKVRKEVAEIVGALDECM